DSRARDESGAASSDEVARARKQAMIGGLIAAALIALATPLLWTTYRPNWLPWPLESYINGVHIYNQPQPWLFPLFPWSAFGFVGLAVGFFLFSEFGKKKETLAVMTLGGVGALACALALLFDSSSMRLYPQATYDYWHTSPNFFLM